MDAPSPARVALVLSYVAIITALAVFATRGEQVRQRVQNVAPSPCTELDALTKRAPNDSQIDRLREDCRDYLKGLAESNIFPGSLGCFIVGSTGLDAPACGRKSHNPVLKRGVRDKAADADSSGARGGGSQPPIAEPVPQSPPSSPQPPVDNPSTPPAPHPPPGNEPGVNVCVKNPFLPACVGLDLPRRLDLP